MAVLPALLYGTEFHEDTSWTLQEVSPSTPAYREQTPPTFSEPPVLQSTCSIDEISSLINSCAKAKVIAVLAMSLFAFDAKLDKRDSWACPLPNCKDNFPDEKALMRHVINCSHLSGDQFYCSCCCGYYNIFDQNPNHHIGCRDSGVSPNDKGSTTSKAMRKLSHIFTRSRSASRSSSQASWHSVSPTSSPGSNSSHPNARAVVNAPPNPATASRQQSLAYPSELPSQPVAPATPTTPPPQKSAGSSGACELYDPTSTIQVAELPSFHRSADSMTGYSSQSTLSALSAIDTACPMFTGAEGFTESPEEDIPMDSLIPTSGFRQGDNLDFLPEYSHLQYPSASTDQFASQSFEGQQRHPSWSLAGGSAPPASFESQQPSNSYTVVSNFCADPYLQQGALFSSRQSVSSQSRNESGDSYSSVASHRAPVTGQSGFPTPTNARQQAGLSRTYGTLSETPLTYMGASFNSPPTEMEDYHCQYCPYRPGGNVAHRKAYLMKHIKSKHILGPMQCPDCGKEISRMDNLKTHQKNSCKKVPLFTGLWQSVRRPAEQALGRNSMEAAYHHAPKRRRQGSRG